MRSRNTAILTASILALWLGLPRAAAAVLDPWVTTQVKMALITSDAVSANDVNVDTVDGVVVLHGTVSSEAAKSAAERAASDIDGVRSVRNLIQVVPSAEARRDAKIADDGIEKGVRAALQGDPALEGSDVEVQSVNDGVVLLGGKAETLSAHRRAMEDAASVEGVKRVESEIQSPNQLADEEIWREGSPEAGLGTVTSAARDLWITSATKLRLVADDQVPALDVDVDSRDGVVTLFGSVPTEQAKATAGRSARNVSGVRDVRNELQVVPASERKVVEKKDADIEKAVKDGLAARPELADGDVDVAVSDGVVRLQGTVQSRADQLAALSVARGTEGVRGLIDDIRVEPPPVSAQ